MKCQLFSGKNEKNIINLSFAEFKAPYSTKIDIFYPRKV